MRADLRSILGLVFACVLAAPATAQEAGVHWQQDIETAKQVAQQTNRLVLIHFWTPTCGPCKVLDARVFNQQAVAAALEAKFVPVKLNANAYPATAQGFGITRVPTDVIITPDGQVLQTVGCPATPAAYIAQVSEVARNYMTQPGSAFDRAVAAATGNPSPVNSAYANLNIAPFQAPSAGGAPVTGSAQVPVAAAAPGNSVGGAPPSQIVTNPAVQAPSAAADINAPTTVAAGPSQITNRYATPAAAAPVQTPIASAPATSSVPPAQTTIATSSAAAPSVPLHAAVPSVAAPAPASPAAPIAPVSPSVAAAGGAQLATAPQLPAGSPPLGFDGYCPVTMKSGWKWTRGDARFGAIHRGRTYLFVGQAEQQKFLENPDLYAPVLSGSDPVLAMDGRQMVDGQRAHSLEYNGNFYLFSTEQTLQQFSASPERYATGVRQAMGLQTSGNVVR